MSVVDRIAMKAATAYTRLTMSSPIYRDRDIQFAMIVESVRDLGGGMRRIRFIAQDFIDNFLRVGADEYFGLLMPQPGKDLRMPDGSRENVRAAIASMDAHLQPALRWYTIRHHDRTAGTIDVDIVTHGDSGPGSQWALSATPGNVAGFRSGGALFRGHESAGPMLLLADETALPALAAILEQHPEIAGRARAIVEVPNREMLAAYSLDGVADLSILERGDDPPGTLALAAVRQLAGGIEYAWFCGESALVTGARRHLVNVAGIDRRQVLFSGYWKLGEARG